MEKSEKNRWRVTTGGAPAVTVKYRVYGREMSVRTNWIEAGFALINGAPTFMTLADRAPRVHEVVIVPAAKWAKSMTGLPEMTGGPHRYRAPDFDTLADSPIVLGNPAVYEFTVDDKKHYLVNEGEGGVFDGPRAAKDLEAMVREHRRMWGSLPYDKYLFLNLLTEAGGGLEHKNSTVLMGSRWLTRTRRTYVSWLELASHEFFHVWNIKRLRPVELGPFDYENEVHTKSLWIAEGVTDYYGDLAVHRAGLVTRDEFLESLSAKIEELQTTPGRTVQSVELASFDAWIKYLPPGRELGEHVDQLLHQGRGGGVPPRRPDPQGDERGPQPRRRDARRLRTVRRLQGLHGRRVPHGRRKGRRHQPEGLLGHRGLRHAGTGLRRGTRRVRPALPLRDGSGRRRAGVAGRVHAQRRGPSGRVAGPPRHARGPLRG